MGNPGEISHEIGRAYLDVLLGALERSIRRFQRTFEVYREPEKLRFQGLSGNSFSFDACGLLRCPVERKEVFIEAKGYQEGSKLIEEYRVFLARAYSVSTLHQRHSSDLFWFVTNVPFGPTIGRALTSPSYMLKSLAETRGSEVAKVLGGAPVDPALVDSLAQRVAVCILTDSFIRVMGVNYRVQRGDTVWSIIKKLHGGVLPERDFGGTAWDVAQLNKLEHPDKIQAGKTLHVPFYGMWARAGGNYPLAEESEAEQPGCPVAAG